MARFVLNKEYRNPETAEADQYQTVGYFIEITKYDDRSETVLGTKSSLVQTIHQVDTTE